MKNARSTRRSLLFLLALALPAWIAAVNGLDAYVRLKTSGGTGIPLKWNPATPGYRIQADGSDDIADKSEETAIDQAFAHWTAAPNSSITVTRGNDLVAPPTVFNDTDGKNVIFFDENDDSGFFAGASPIIAITPVFFNPSNGVILEADMLFNGQDHTFSTTLQAGHFDVQSIATHEAGHFIGLDHTGALAATMVPFAQPAITFLRSLESDDLAGAAEAYPAGSGFGSISGKARRAADGSAINGAHLVAVAQTTGMLAATASSRTNGNFLIDGLAPGDYLVYATPLEGPVKGNNLQIGSVDTDFAPTLFGGNGSPLAVTVLAGADTPIGNLDNGADDARTSSTSSRKKLNPGASKTFTLTLPGWSPPFDVQTRSAKVTVTNVVPATGSASVTVQAAVDAAPGLYDLFAVTTSGPVSFTPVLGMLEVIAPAPGLTGLNPASGPVDGGDTITFTGSDFQPGSFVTFGGVGAASVTFVSSTQLQVVTPAHAVGTVDVTVISPDGQQGSLAGAFNFEAAPTILTVFPVAGQAAGGTEVTLTGANFTTDAVVRFGGTDSPSVTFVSTTTLKAATPAGVAGSADVEVEVPGQTIANQPGAFTYKAAPDPVITSMSPHSGDFRGGEVLLIKGTNLGASPQVFFSADQVTGQGGKAAAVVSPGEGPGDLKVTTPKLSKGTHTVLLVTENDQAVFANAVFKAFNATASGGSGGGCGGMVAGGGGGPPDAGDALALLLWVGVWFGLRRRGGRRG